MSVVNILLFAQKELRDARRNCWVWLYTLVFVALASALAWLGLSALGSFGGAGFGRTGASLINLILLIVPLMGLTLGALSVAGERERGTLLYFLAHPVSTTDVVLGKFLGLALALIAALGVGFGLSGLFISWQGGLVHSDVYFLLFGLTVLLALMSLALGFLVSVLARKGATAMGAALFLWLFLVFVSDLGLMGTALVLRLGPGSLLALALLNPLQSFKLMAVLLVQGNGEVLGPVGLYALRALGDFFVPLLIEVLMLWAVGALALSVMIFRRRGALE